MLVKLLLLLPLLLLLLLLMFRLLLLILLLLLLILLLLLLILPRLMLILLLILASWVAESLPGEGWCLFGRNRVAAWLREHRSPMLTGLLVVILIFRPQGLLGRPLVAKV